MAYAACMSLLFTKLWLAWSGGIHPAPLISVCFSAYFWGPRTTVIGDGYREATMIEYPSEPVVAGMTACRKQGCWVFFTLVLWGRFARGLREPRLLDL